jgi:hypothetical protein
MTDWTHKNQLITELPEDCVGFVYIVTNTESGKRYIGKKLAKFAKTKYRIVKLKNGTKKRKKIKEKIDSDWLTYYGSSNDLTADIEALGKSCFTREILYYCYSKAECSYVEMYEQVTRGVLESDDWYNGIINVRIKSSAILKTALTEMRKQGKLK